MEFISAEIIKGGRWPPAGRYIYAYLSGLESWPTFLLDQNGEPILDQNGDALLSQETTLDDWSWGITVYTTSGVEEVSEDVTAEVSGTGMKVALSLSPSNTAELEEKEGGRVYLELWSMDASDNKSIYPQALMTTRVREPGEN